MLLGVSGVLLRPGCVSVLWRSRRCARRALTAILGITVGVILSNGGRAELTTVFGVACLLLSVPAIASTLSLLVLGTIARARRST